MNYRTSRVIMNLNKHTIGLHSVTDFLMIQTTDYFKKQKCK